MTLRRALNDEMRLRRRVLSDAEYLRELWDAHDTLEREILHVGRKFTDKELTRMMDESCS